MGDLRYTMRQTSRMSALAVFAVLLTGALAFNRGDEAQDLIQLDEQQPPSEAAMSLKIELRGLAKLKSRAERMMSATESQDNELKEVVQAKTVEAEIPIVSTGELGALEAIEKAMNPKAAPCADFSDYVCGRWINDTAIPGDKPAWSKTFSEISKRHTQTLKGIMSGATQTELEDHKIQKVRDYYSACINRTDSSVIQTAFTSMTAQINNMSNVKEMETLWGQMEVKGLSLATFDFGSGADDKDPDKEVAFLSQGGLGLPGPEYYTKTNARFTQLRQGYVALIEKVFQTVSVPNFKLGAEAANILAFETKLANASWTPVQMRDPQATYNPSTLGEFQAKHLSFENYFNQITAAYPQFGNASKLVVNTPPFLDKLEVILSDTPFATLKAYTMWRLLKQTVSAISDDYGQMMFAFYGTTMAGVTSRPPLWKRCVQDTTSSLWELSDQVFIEQQFSGESKVIAKGMLEGVKTAFSERLKKLTWMDSESKNGAATKIATLSEKIGYPDKWRSYSNLSIGTDFFTNYLAVQQDGAHQNLMKLGAVVDKTKWGMNPSMVNAYYSPGHNEMAFPAGILQPPFFSKDFPMVINFGSIGSVMGHELSHGFDDQGSQYDSSGKMHEWFTNSSKVAFQNLTQCYVDMYSAFEVPEVNLKVNGKLTLGENIADNAGVQLALDAYRVWAKQNNAPRAFPLNVQMFTDIQLFWIAYGQVWCSKHRPKALMLQMRNDPHSPGRFRTTGPAKNSADFSEAFQCAAGSKMVPTHRCELW